MVVYFWMLISSNLAIFLPDLTTNSEVESNAWELLHYSLKVVGFEAGVRIRYFISLNKSSGCPAILV